jgi:hypothetical protein
MAENPSRHIRGAYSRNELHSVGVTESELRGVHWRRAYHGRHQWAHGTPDSPADRILAAFSVLPRHGALSGWAAAYFHGAKDLDGRTWNGEVLPVPFVLPLRLRVRRHGIVTTRAPLTTADVVEWDDHLVTSPERTCFDLMRLAPLEDAVVAADAMLRARVVERGTLENYIASHRGWQGVRTARKALALATEHAASCPESLMRVVWIADAALPAPLVNVGVRNPAGQLLGVPDLLDEASGLVGEYDGAHHRTLQNHTADNVREERLEEHNLTVVRATALDLYVRRAGLVRRLRRGYERARARDKSRDRWVCDMR